MALKYFDRVKETSATTGTGAVSLGGAVTGFRAFSLVLSNADTVYYVITDQASSANWEVGIGTYASSGNTLARTTVLASSNAGAAVNFTSGALYVFCALTAAGVGTLGSPEQPQGKLTLQSATAVQTADQTAKGTIYYVPYLGGGLVPYYTGSLDAYLSIGSGLTLTLDATNHLSGKVYDVFLVSNSGSALLVTGPAWTNLTTRFSALDFSTRNYITNAASLAHAYNNSVDYGAVAANQATYLGSFYCTANGQTGVALKPASGSSVLCFVGLFNAYRRSPVRALNRNSTAAWSYSSSTWRVADGNSTNNVISFLDGLGVINTLGRYIVDVASSGVSAAGKIGVNMNSTTATPDSVSAQEASATSTLSSIPVEDAFYPVLGWNSVYPMESVGGSGSATYSQLNLTTLVLETEL